jgi:hypothetical protein
VHVLRAGSRLSLGQASGVGMGEDFAGTSLRGTRRRFRRSRAILVYHRS